MHFVIGGGAGGGWDGTARGTGEALTKAGMLKSASFENMSGGGGGKALAYMINTKPANTVLVQSTPLVLRSITRHKGYVKGNVILVSMLANCIKNQATPDQILTVGNYYKKLYQEKGINYA